MTYYPKYSDVSTLSLIVRIGNSLILCFLINLFLTVDSLVIIHLILMGFKFVTLRNYFLQFRKDLNKNALNNTPEIIAKRLRQGCLEGIQMHQKLLRLVFLLLKNQNDRLYF